MVAERNTLFAACEERILSLNKLYSEYAQHGGPSEKKDIGTMFSNWMRPSKVQIEPEHKVFLDSVQQEVSELEANLAALADLDLEACEELAGRALAFIFAKKPKKETTDVERYLAISEYHAPCLFRYASRTDLERIRIGLLERVPKRLMFPRHRELVDLLEQMIGD